jgi:hypothetical protein
MNKLKKISVALALSMMVLSTSNPGNVKAAEPITYNDVDITSYAEYDNDYSTGYYDIDSDTLYVTAIKKDVSSNSDYSWSAILGIKNIVFLDTVTEIPADIFKENTSIKSVEFSNKVTSIGANAFTECTGLEEVTIPNTCTTLGAEAFKSCTGLTKVTLGSLLDVIGDSAFEDCTNLEKVDASGNIRMNTVGKNVFKDCTSLTVADLGSPKFTTLPEGIFKGCTSIYDISFQTSKLTGVGDSAFEDCTSLGEITMPSSVKTVGDNAFKGCTHLSTIGLSSSLTTIGKNSFDGIAETELVVPSTVTSIGDSAFANNSKLTTLTLSSDSLVIGEKAFSECPKLTTIFVDCDSLTIGDNAFKVTASEELKTNVTVNDGKTAVNAYDWKGSNRYLYKLTIAFVAGDTLNENVYDEKQYAIGYTYDLTNLISNGEYTAKDGKTYKVGSTSVLKGSNTTANSDKVITIDIVTGKTDNDVVITINDEFYDYDGKLEKTVKRKDDIVAKGGSVTYRALTEQEILELMEVSTYEIDGDSSVTLTASKDQTVTFKYKSTTKVEETDDEDKQYTVTVMKYLYDKKDDEDPTDTEEVSKEDYDADFSLTVTAPTVEDYKLFEIAYKIGDADEVTTEDDSITITITGNTTIIYKYAKKEEASDDSEASTASASGKTYTVTITDVLYDTTGNVIQSTIRGTQQVSDGATFTAEAFNIDGYSVIGESTISKKITSDTPIQFSYRLNGSVSSLDSTRSTVSNPKTGDDSMDVNPIVQRVITVIVLFVIVLVISAIVSKLKA